MSNRPPYGLFIQLKPRMFVALPTHVTVMKSLYEKRIAGERMVDIARWMRANAPPLTYKNGNEFNLVWSYARLKRVIGNPAYVNTIVDEATWLRAQRTAKYVGKAPPRVRRHGEFLLSYMLRCECGRTLCAHARNLKRCAAQGRGPDRYYCCAAPWNHGEKQITHKADVLESLFEEFLRALAADPDQHHRTCAYAEHGASIAKLNREIGSLRERLTKIEAGRARVWRLDDLGLLEPLEIAKRFDELKAKAEIVASRIVKLLQERTLRSESERRDVDLAAFCSGAWSTYISGDFQTRVDIARTVVASLGGLRVAPNGIFLGGRGKHATPQEKLKRRDESCWIFKPRYKGRFVRQDDARLSLGQRAVKDQ